jgi:hypothetical protein
MNFGRIACVALPFLFTVASIITFLIATLGSVGSDSLYIFQVNLTNFGLDPSDLASIAGDLGADLGNLPRDASIQVASPQLLDRSLNLTAADIGLADTFDVGVWGWCTTDQNGKRSCMKPEFNWAASKLNTTWLDNIGNVAGLNITLPKDVNDALKTFRTGVKWTEVAYIAAGVALGVELVLSLFTGCSRAVSCVTWLVASIAAALVCVAAGATTAISVIVVAAIKTEAKTYGVQSKIGTRDLVVIWLAAAFAVGAAATWIFTVCCCKPEHRYGSTKRRSLDDEKLLPSSYAPLAHEHDMSGATGYNNYNNANNYNSNVGGEYNRDGQFGQQETGYEQPAQYAQFDEHDDSYVNTNTNARYPSGRSDLGYEPYMHRA